MKTCTKCKEEKEITEFYKNKNYRDGLYYYCKSCSNKETLDWKARNPQKSKNHTRNSKLKSNYGITLEIYNKMFSSQDGKCYICGKHQSEFKIALCVDHSHSTGKVRALLCNPCNVGLGYYELYSNDYKRYLKEYND